MMDNLEELATTLSHDELLEITKSALCTTLSCDSLMSDLPSDLILEEILAQVCITHVFLQQVNCLLLSSISYSHSHRIIQIQDSKLILFILIYKRTSWKYLHVIYNILLQFDYLLYYRQQQNMDSLLQYIYLVKMNQN